MYLFVVSNTIVFFCLLFSVFCFISGGSRRIFVQSLNGKAVFFRLFGFDSQLNNYFKKMRIIFIFYFILFFILYHILLLAD